MARTASTETAPPRWREVFAGARGRLTTGLLTLEALLASMWILPGLLGPPVGAVIAETVGWRWAVLRRTR
jgi:MFS family permease